VRRVLWGPSVEINASQSSLVYFHVVPEEHSMTGFFIVSGIGLLCLGLAVVRVVVTLRGPRSYPKNAVDEPVVIPEYRRSARKDARSTHP
jgi:hypothetical protein